MQLHLIALGFNLNGINKIIFIVSSSRNSKNFRKYQANQLNPNFILGQSWFSIF